MTALLNPYIAGNPIKDQAYFVGRDDVLREVHNTLHNPQNNAITLYGQRRIGKTSILYQVQNQLLQEGTYTPIFFDWQRQSGHSLNTSLYALAQTIVNATQPQDIEPIRDDLTGVHFREKFLPGAARIAPQHGLAFLFDEVDLLEAPLSSAVLSYLQTLIPNLERVKYVFTLSRRPETLAAEVLSTFKGVRATRVSLLAPTDTVAIIRRTQQAKSLEWDNTALHRVWILTQGHPYLTQLLCSVIWEKAYESQPNVVPRIQEAEVKAAVTKTLEQGANAFHWIWNGLPPAERIILSVIAEAKQPAITQEQIEHILNNNGVRLIMRELKLAPDTLVDGELLRTVERGYQFSVPLFQLWVANNRPLRRIKEELDRLDPLAETLFQASQSFYRLEQIDNAEAQVRQSLRINPNHLGAQLLLGRILLETQHLAEAVTTLETAYSLDEAAVTPDLTRALLALAETENDEAQKLALYARVLTLAPQQPIALEQARLIWLARGERSFKAGDLEAATTAFTYAQSQTHLDRVRQMKLRAELHAAQQLEATEQWLEAQELYKALRTQYALIELDEKISYCAQRIRLKFLYDKACRALQDEKRSLAAAVLSKIIAHEPTYKDAALLLVRAVRGPSADSWVRDLELAPVEQRIINIPPNWADAEALGVTASPVETATAPASVTVEPTPSLPEENFSGEEIPFNSIINEASLRELNSVVEEVVVAPPLAEPANIEPPASTTLPNLPPRLKTTAPLQPTPEQLRRQLLTAVGVGMLNTLFFSLISLLIYGVSMIIGSASLRQFLTQTTGLLLIFVSVLVLPTLIGLGVGFFVYRRNDPSKRAKNY